MITPFVVSVPEEELSGLRARLTATRWPDQLQPGSWEDGADLRYVQELCDYWRHEFDWRAAEATLNRWPQFLVTIDGQRLHFVHARSPHSGALPLLLTHGWPSSTFEFSKVIDRLLDPVVDGGSPADAFHVVCMSLPGYGWGGPTTEPGWHIRRVAAAQAELMHLLEYGRYAVHGGDWGAIAGAHLATLDADHVVGIHLAKAPSLPPTLGPGSSHDPADRALVARLRRWVEDDAGYSAIQSTRPQTLAYSLVDSPAGLAAWMVEKFRGWSDCGGDVERAFSRNEMLTTISTYWFTATAGSAARLYAESRRNRLLGRPPEQYVTVPTAATVFPRDIGVTARHWAERHYNIVRWTEMPRGGHFPAMEVPDLLIEDIRASFRPLRARVSSG